MTDTVAPKAHPLELIIRPDGNVELLNSAHETVWTSDGDNDFWEFIDTDFCQEEDFDEIYAYLEDAGILSNDELSSFETGEFDTYVEDADGLDEDENEDEEKEDDETEIL